MYCNFHITRYLLLQSLDVNMVWFLLNKTMHATVTHPFKDRFTGTCTYTACSRSFSDTFCLYSTSFSVMFWKYFQVLHVWMHPFYWGKYTFIDVLVLVYIWTLYLCNVNSMLQSRMCKNTWTRILVFVFRNDEHFGCSSKNNGVDMDNVRKLMNRIADAKNVNIIQQVM